MPRLRVAEKTLELNICAEILAIVRGHPGCGSAVWVGLTQAQERHRGLDEELTNLPRAMYLALQFKAPAPPPSGAGGRFRFPINERQNDSLLRLSGVRPGAVHYVLPEINTVRSLRRAAPNLLASAVAVAVESTRPFIGRHGTDRKGGGTGRLGSHHIETRRGIPRAVLRSEPRPIPSVGLPVLMDALLSNVEADEREGDLLNRDDITEWSLGFAQRDDLTPAQKGQILRGLRFVGI